MQPIVFSARSAGAINQELEARLAQGARPALAIVFAAYKLVNDALLEPFRSRNIDVFGGASAEEIADDRLQRDSVTVMLLELDRRDYALSAFPEPADFGASRSELSAGLGAAVAHRALSQFADPTVLVLAGGAGLSFDIDDFLQGLFERRPGLPVFGGLASAGDAASEPPCFDAERIYPRGVLALALDNSKIELKGVAISGWLDVGTPKRITRSKGNLVYEIEGIPALEFYERYFKMRPDSAEQILSISEYPIRLIQEDGRRSIRTAARIDAEEQAVVFGGNIPEGSLVRFCSPNIVETMQHTAEELQAFQAANAAQGASGVILFDCAIRSRSFGNYMRKEIEVIKHLWQAPLAGFSSWGEIGPAPGEACSFHNTVISMVVIRDRNSATSPTPVQRYSGEQIVNLAEAFDPDADLESLRREIVELRKQKTMLSNFLHYTSDDLQREREKSDELLLNILPGPVAERLKSGERTIADSAEATILFADLVGFTELSGRLGASELVRILNRLFSSFDELAFKYGVEKIKTIGDAYMAAAGIPEPRTDHAALALKLAKGLLKILKLFNEKYDTELQLRVGLNSGPVVAGVIGKRKFSYDLWGDAVNVASRMESHGEPGRIHLSESTYQLLRNGPGLSDAARAESSFENRGEISIKGKGAMQTYLYCGPAAEET